jgi:hypothetical protein
MILMGCSSRTTASAATNGALTALCGLRRLDQAKLATPIDCQTDMDVIDRLVDGEYRFAADVTRLPCVWSFHIISIADLITSLPRMPNAQDSHFFGFAAIPVANDIGRPAEWNDQLTEVGARCPSPSARELLQ